MENLLKHSWQELNIRVSDSKSLVLGPEIFISNTTPDDTGTAGPQTSSEVRTGELKDRVDGKRLSCPPLHQHSSSQGYCYIHIKKQNPKDQFYYRSCLSYQ